MLSAGLEPISAHGVTGFDGHRLEHPSPNALPADVVDQEVLPLGPQESPEATLTLICGGDHSLL